MANQTKTKMSNELKQGVLALLLGGSVTVAMFYLSAKLIVNRMLAQSTFFFFATAALCIGCFITSAILAFQRKSGGLLCGMVCFVAFSVILLASGWMCGTRTVSSATLLRLVLLCTSACLGGCIGVAKALKRARRHHKRS